MPPPLFPRDETTPTPLVLFFVIPVLCVSIVIGVVVSIILNRPAKEQQDDPEKQRPSLFQRKLEEKRKRAVAELDSNVILELEARSRMPELEGGGREDGEVRIV
jgi:hypothetical protein